MTKIRTNTRRVIERTGCTRGESPRKSLGVRPTLVDRLRRPPGKSAPAVWMSEDTANGSAEREEEVDKDVMLHDSWLLLLRSPKKRDRL
jgi:hypothetical protein